ncbi:MAG: GH92 family glycosyl hydrolase [Clostridia bacterium]|nr:GH92 family glycosyl hydrolase [Clostridia bacterium]
MWRLMRIFVSGFIAVESLLGNLANSVAVKGVDMPEVSTGEYTQYVDPFIGTGGVPWTCGMLSPAACAPFGAVRLGADTSFVGGAFVMKTNTSGYYYEHGHIRGFSHSRLSGTGATDYGIFRVTPVIGNKEAGAIPFSHKNEVASAGYYGVYLKSLGCLAEMTADQHTGVHRYTFNHSENARLSLDVTSAAGDNRCTDGFASFDEEAGLLTGGAVLRAVFSDRYDGLPVYFAARADKKIKSCTITGDDTNLIADISFGSLQNESVELKVAISFVSVENALLNLEEETKDLDFDGVHKKTLADWEKHLSSIKIKSADEDIKKAFYTALYHTMIMPTNYTDLNGEYLGFDKKTHTAEGYTYRSDMSLWDTCRNTHALYMLIEPQIQKDCLNSLVDMAQRGGSLPRWPMGAGYAGSMFGDPANIMITESYLKNYRDFDVDTAYEYMKKSSDSRMERAGREYADAYNEYGYVPNDLEGVSDSVSHTLEYAWEDGALSTLAAALGKTEDAEKYAAKSMNYKNLFDPETKYFRAKNTDGSFDSNFNTKLHSYFGLGFLDKYVGCYCEGSANHWRYSATQDIDGMIALFGSEEYFVSELESFMEGAAPKRAYWNPGAGYWIGNQHDIHTPYLFANAGRQDLTQKWVRWTLQNRFSTDTNGLDGNDDGGTISAWYVFSAMGFYPLAGTDQYWLGSPNLDSAQITLPNGKTLKITALNQSEENVYVESVTLNGKELKDVYVTHAQLMNGGELVFTMSNEATTK